MQQDLPDFLIIGAAKAGTTSLYEYLIQHPEVYMSPIKEPHFFSRDIKPSNFNKRYYSNSVIDLKEYFSNDPLPEKFLAFVEKEEDYRKLFKAASPGKVKGESSTSYIFSESAAKEIRKLIPEAKIIAILRNPVSRAYSHYLMAFKFGYTSLPFMEALKKDRASDKKGWGISELFLELGCYYEQLKRYYDIFPREQIKIILNEDLKNDTNEVLKGLCHFLGISEYDFNLDKEHNKAGLPRFVRLNEYLNKIGLRTSLAQKIPPGIKDRLRKIYLKEGSLPSMNIEEKQFLLDYYREDIEKTASLTGLDLKKWLN